MSMLKQIFIISVCFSLSYAEKINTKLPEPNYYDIVHANVSKKVIDWSNLADTTISEWLGYDESNLSCASTQILKPKSKTIDAFFQNNKYFNETEDTFILFRTDSDFQSKK